jgi:hypothetical protein
MSRELPKAARDHLTLKRAVASRRRLAALLGIIAAEWSYADTLLGFFFAELIGSRNMPTAEAYSKILSDKNKAHIVLALASQISDTALRARFKTAVNDLQHCGTDRNKYIHGKWAIHPAFPKELVLLTPKRSYLEEARLYGASDFNKLINEIRRITVRLWKMLDTLERKRREATQLLGYNPGHPLPNPGRIRRILHQRSIAAQKQ